jgi:hypothetical protein
MKKNQLLLHRTWLRKKPFTKVYTIKVHLSKVQHQAKSFMTDQKTIIFAGSVMRRNVGACIPATNALGLALGDDYVGVQMCKFIKLCLTV